jgi:hypothetical protein
MHGGMAAWRHGGMAAWLHGCIGASDVADEFVEKRIYPAK